ncbi:hypothetical protein BRD22_07875 [Halobacteriales archaeon SW_8_68_21]|nr:MAG: hypothetical protein BRD22_07875 [Halobacteriales archaeon SW_8_68_21]
MSSDSSSGRDPNEAEATWVNDRTTFQRVYDVVTGLTAYQPADVVADRARCSPDGARNALGQLAEMGVVDRRGDRPVEYRRNESYFQWKRIERLAAEHTSEELRSRVERLLDEDADLQREFGVPDPDAVPAGQLGDATHGEIHDRLEALARWRTVRHDVELLQRAVSRASGRHGDGDIEASA